MDEPTTRTDIPPDRVTALWRRAKEHRVAQWTVGYVAVAYGIQHAVILTSESFEWPNIVARGSMLAFVLGLPLVIVFAWYHGEQTTKRISRGELSIISLLLVIGAFLFYTFAKPSEQSAGAEPGAKAASVTGLSIAVLPFANLSGDTSQEFFSDGMTDEIMTALAKVPALRVVGRESAFQFKDRKTDMKAVGQVLGAAYLVEGSVRKAGDQVRITAQLVQADNGVSLWTETYDRELKNIFATQSDIAQSIAGALRAPLGLKQGETLVSNRTEDLESYQQYLRAKLLVRARGTGVAQAISILERTVARDANYAPAWALLAQAYTYAPLSSPEGRRSTLEEISRLVRSSENSAERAAKEAIRLDPRNALGYGILAQVQASRGQWLSEDDFFDKSLALDPNDPDVLADRAFVLNATGRLKEGLRSAERAAALDPAILGFRITRAVTMQTSGLNRASIAILETIPPDFAGGLNRNIYLARAYAAEGRFNDAANTLASMRTDLVSPDQAASAVRLLRSAPAKTAAPETLPAFESVGMSFVYAYVGAPERAMDRVEALRDRQLIGPAYVDTLWLPIYAPVRKTERFKAYVRSIGLVDYWKARGWPDLCHPVGSDDFACN